MRTYLRIALPLCVLLLGGGIMAQLILSAKKVEEKPRVEVAPLVRVMAARATNLTFSIDSQGTVTPGTQINLITEIAGRMVEVTPRLADGSFFAAGALLARIDDRDFELAVVQAEARLAEARARLLREEAEADVAREEWNELKLSAEPSPLALREPQLAEAQAQLSSAEAALEQARRDLDRTEITAPFAGRVLRKSVDTGQYLPRGATIAEIYSIDTAEIKLPLPASEAAFVELPFHYEGKEQVEAKPEVRLTANFAGKTFHWHGVVSRTEGAINPGTRMVTVIASVPDPYNQKAASDRPPLTSGMFVTADIAGRSVEGVFVVPRTAIYNQNKLLIIDDQDRLRLREVEVIRREAEHAVIGDGLTSGERICLSTLEAPVDGMKVRMQEEAPDGKPGGAQ